MELAKGNVFLSDCPGSHCLRFSFLLGVSLKRLYVLAALLFVEFQVS